MDPTRTTCSPDQPLRQALEQLSPALNGFPVDELLDVYMSADPPDRAHAYDVVDRCLVNWIATLEATISGYPGDLIGELAAVRSRQSGTRDALVRLKTLLSWAQGSQQGTLN